MSEYKYGDRVEVTSCSTYAKSVRKGLQGTIISVAPVRVQFDEDLFDGEPDGTTWYVSGDDDCVLRKIEPAVETQTKPKTRKPPKGTQMYLGNGEHTWEDVTGNTVRLRVPGGWLYAEMFDDFGNIGTMVFVPMPTVVGYGV